MIEARCNIRVAVIINPLYSDGFYHTDKCNKEWGVHYILRGHMSKFPNNGVFTSPKIGLISSWSSLFAKLLV